MRTMNGHQEADQIPLMANLAVINGDLMELVYRLRQALAESLTGSPTDFPELAQRAELLLRFVRQVDRLAQLDRQFTQVTRSGTFSSLGIVMG
jgi:hypothetical protein